MTLDCEEFRKTEDNDFLYLQETCPTEPVTPIEVIRYENKPKELLLLKRSLAITLWRLFPDIILGRLKLGDTMINSLLSWRRRRKHTEVPQVYSNTMEVVGVMLHLLASLNLQSWTGSN